MNIQRFTTIFKQDGFWLMLHFLLRDALALSLLAFAGLMTIEGLMPGFVSGHLNLAKVLFAIALLFFAFIGIGQQPAFAKATAWQGKTSKWLITGLLFWSSLLILNSLIKFPLYAIVITFLLTAVIGKLLYDEFFTK
ncbi:MAG: hypothetical protein PHT88_01550 [Candidatus Moranbacteria bacterium]|nr:hypothetical protein [Candidatus Moranbacteria bacterium]